MIRREKRGISPVIATIMMIALTVMLATAVVVFVSGVTQKPPPPTAYLSVTAKQDSVGYYLEVSHGGGDNLKTSTLAITVNGKDSYYTWSAEEFGAGYIVVARVGIVLHDGDNVMIVHTPSGVPILQKTTITNIGTGPGDTTRPPTITGPVFTITVSGGSFSGWSLVSKQTLGGRQVLKLSADTLTIGGFSVQELGMTGSSFIANSGVIYATEMTATAYGIPVNFKGDEEISPALLNLLPDPCPFEGATIKLVRQEATSETVSGVELDTTVSAYVRGGMTASGWAFKGGGKCASSGVYQNCASITHNGVSVTEVSGNIIVLKNVTIERGTTTKWRVDFQTGTITEGGKLYDTHTKGSIQGIEVGWRGTDPVPEALKLLPDPIPDGLLGDIEATLVYLSGGSLEMQGLTLSVS